MTIRHTPVSYTHLEFLRENPLRTAELSTEQNENMSDGVLNNAPSLGELEAKAKAGEQSSLTDLAAAVKAEEKAPKAKTSRAAKPKKPIAPPFFMFFSVNAWIIKKIIYLCGVIIN